MNVHELMNRYYGDFNEVDKSICNYIMEHKDSCHRYSIDEFAARCHVSKTTLFRFAGKISLRGFSELKAKIRLEAAEQTRFPSDFLSTVQESYHKMVETLKHRDCQLLFEQMTRARRILIYGSGYAQARVASEWKRIFLPLRQTMLSIHGHDMAEPLAHLAKNDDYVVIISLSGESPMVLRLAEELRLRQIPALSVTRMRNNRLASLCAHSLYIHSIPLPANYGLNYEISTPYFILIEILFLKYQVYLSALPDEHNSKK